MDLKEERNKRILLIVLVAAVILLGVYKLFFENKKEQAEQIDTETISVVTNANDFYTVSSCVSKFLSYLSINDTENLLILLSDEYKKENSVTQDNIYNFISALNGVYNFNPRKMFVQRTNKNTYKFYIYGLIEQESMELISDSMDYYIVVILDKENGTFAIEPYDGSMFK